MRKKELLTVDIVVLIGSLLVDQTNDVQMVQVPIFQRMKFKFLDFFFVFNFFFFY